MGKHITIILFDSTDSVFKNSVLDFQEKLRKTVLNKESIVYFLKISTDSDLEKNELLMYQYNKEDNTETKLDSQFTFKNPESLGKCFEFLYSTIEEPIDPLDKKNKNRWYFICIGHGYGYSLFDYDNNISNFPINNNIDNILYTTELVEIFGKIHFSLCIMNTCNFSLFDNCFLFSDKTQFLIGTENHTSIIFFDIEEYIYLLNRRIKNGSESNSYLLSLSVIKMMELKIKNNNTSELAGSTIFLFNFEIPFITTYVAFNKIAKQLVNKYLFNYDTWYQEFRESINGTDKNFIDLYKTCQKLKQLFPENNIIKANCKIVTDNIEKFKIIKKKKYDPTENFLGISIYLPQYGKNFDWHYDRFRNKFEENFKSINWYDFVEEIVQKTKTT